MATADIPGAGQTLLAGTQAGPQLASDHPLTGPARDRLLQGLVTSLLRDGHARASARLMAQLVPALSAAKWRSFARTWDDLALDLFMRDRGRYRRRRYAAYRVTEGQASRLPHRPHFQSREHNPLNGGVDRWFAPVAEAADGRLLRSLVGVCGAVFSGVTSHSEWDCETHQVRTLAECGRASHPTPEGRHRDGVDGVMIMLVRRCNLVGGVTRLTNADGQVLDEFVLTEPGEAVFLNDRRLLHEVTSVRAAVPDAPGIRDTLIVTLCGSSAEAASRRSARA